MIALITGASSGIGRDMAKILSQKGYDLILVARNIAQLETLGKELTTNTTIISTDLSEDKACFELYEQVKDKHIDILINNAGCGVYGKFTETDLDKELNMIDINIKTVHILTKLFLKDFRNRNSGYILNVSSSAAFLPGPLLSSYYASKAYVLRLTQAIYEELRRERSKVYIGALCPGPVATNFDKIAGVKSSLNALRSFYVANYAIEKMFKKKIIIVPGFTIKLARFFNKITPDKLLVRIAYTIQKRKG
jgi:short-subunit dehydrogenase